MLRAGAKGNGPPPQVEKAGWKRNRPAGTSPARDRAALRDYPLARRL